MQTIIKMANHWDVLHIYHSHSHHLAQFQCLSGPSAFVNPSATISSVGQYSNLAVSDEVILNVNMLHLCVMLGIVLESDSALIVAVDGVWLAGIVANFFEEV
jgi:hypothetical protein